MNQGYFAYVDQDTFESNGFIKEGSKTFLGMNSQSSFAGINTKYYNNLKIIPKNQSKNTLTN